jgi:lipopolysaccharide biosynthesis glycosyltransferase
MSEVIRVFVGYDPCETIAYHVCCQSIIENCSAPVAITPIGIQTKPAKFNRPRGPKDSTDFAITRFLAPFMCGFLGKSIFLDCDIIVEGDLKELFELVEDSFAVSVVKHNYVPVSQNKFMGQEQTSYSRKNWSSVMLFNNALCTELTLDYVQNAPGLDLHQFRWCADDQIGTLPPEWNFLVGEYKPIKNPSLLHYTLGGPYFDEYKECDFHQNWFEYFKKASIPIR